MDRRFGVQEAAPDYTQNGANTVNDPTFIESNNLKILD
jgi:hypothetical protein